MAGIKLRQGANLGGLEWTFDRDLTNQSKLVRITLFWHDANGPVLTFYAINNGLFNQASWNQIVNPGVVDLVYLRGGSPAHTAIHSLRDIAVGVVENSINADPHTHVQATTGGRNDAQLEQALTAIIWDLVPLGLIYPSDAVQSCRYFQSQGWA